MEGFDDFAFLSELVRLRLGDTSSSMLLLDLTACFLKLPKVGAADFLEDFALDGFSGL